MEPIDLALKQAREIARSVLNGSADPNYSCAKLAELCQRSGWPKELVTFSTLAHEQTGHEEFGLNAENTAPLIVEACRSLLKGEQ